MDPNAHLIPLAGIALCFAMPLALVAVILFYKQRRNRLVQETVIRLAEKGLPVPPELLSPPRPRANLTAGLVLVALGTGLSAFLFEVGAPWSLGLIPGLMGLALVLAWKLDDRPDRGTSR